MSRIEYLAEIVAYDPSLPGTTTLRYSSLGKVTGPAETPANTEYAPRLVEPGDFKRSIMEVAARGVRPQVTIGDVLLINTDGALDGLTEYGFDGRALTIRLGTEGAAYPAGYPIIFAGTMEDAEVTRERVRIRLRDNATLLSVPLQTNTYAGDNALPDGLEGVEGDLKGKAKPLVYGRVTNIAPPCVNTAKLIYQVNDGAVVSVPEVFDRGISLNGQPVGWTAVSHGIAGDVDLRGAARNGQVIVACGGDAVTPDGLSVVSADGGATWTKYIAVAGFGGTANWCTYGEGVFAAGFGATCYTSADNGQTWTSRGTAGNADGIYAPVNGIFVSVSASAAFMYTSPDAVTAWTARATGTASPLRGICEGPDGRLVIVGDAGTIITSDDAGVTWTPRTCPVTTNLFSVRNNGREYIAVGASGGIVTSTTGTEWSARSSGVTVGLLNPAYADGRWVCCGNFNGFPVSSDGGATWYRPDDTVPAGTYYELIRTATGWLAIGDNVLAQSYEVTDYADATDLEDDSLAPPPGTYATYLAGGYIRLGSPPAGLITADVTQGATAADRTAGSLFENVLTKHGLTSAAWSTADVTALDSADNGEQGLYVSEGETPTVEEVIDRIAASVGAWWTTDAAGLYRIARLLAPSGTPVLTLTENDVIGLERLPSERPSYRSTVLYARNVVTQDSDLALGVSDARRAALAKEWREAFDEDAAVQTAHPLAVATVEESLYADAADAEAEATRRQALRGAKRHRYTLTCALTTATEALALGSVITLEYPRFGLDAGELCRILAIEPQRARKMVSLTLWR